ncbi:DUF4430 domain-containing protein [Lentibacillus lipolyticus]|nr:DUF4430 domain-containing protein [Lentibacillus lipolyticus]
MYKWLLRLASMVFIAGLIAGCGANEEQQSQTGNQNQQTEDKENTEEQSEDTVKITITKDNGEEYIHEKDIEVEEGAILMDVLKENFYVETEQAGKFITSIERVAPKEGENKAWMFTVNGKMANVGAASYELSPGDEVNFDLHAYE